LNDAVPTSMVTPSVRSKVSAVSRSIMRLSIGTPVSSARM
jgi:hypothetical protein